MDNEKENYNGEHYTFEDYVSGGEEQKRELRQELEGKEEVLDFFVSLTPEELAGVDNFVQANKDTKLGVGELKEALYNFRLERAQRRAKEAPLADKLKSASSMADKEKILAEANLIQNPIKHYFQGKPLPPTFTGSLQDKSRKLVSELEIYNEQRFNAPKREMSRRDPKPERPIDLSENEGLPPSWKVISNKL